MSLLTAGHAPTEGSASTVPPDRRGRLAFWRSPEGQPRWARPALLGIAALATLLFAWNLRSAGYSGFYSTAVKSMSVSWKAICYGALDPGATITLDKLAGSFLPQALSARIFGFHQWSLALPQVIEGVVAVLAMYRVTRRWVGERLGGRGAAVAGLLSAGIFGLTPIIASMFGHAMEDGALTMCLVLAVDRFQVAVNRARPRSLAFAAVWVGVGFQCKMLQAWMIVPALAVGYLLFAPAALRRRIVHLVAAGAVLIAVSLSWVMLYTVTPAKDRPYVDGSSNNSAVAMVFGYNGLERFGIHVPGSLPAMGAGRGARPGGVSGVSGRRSAGGHGSTGRGTAVGPTGSRGAGRPADRFGGGPGRGRDSGPTKLLGDRFGTQIGWLYPLALLSLAIGIWWHRRSPRTDRLRAGYVMWGVWALCTAGVLSAINVPHTAYVASLAPPMAALSAVGIVLAWRAFAEGGARAWLLPAMLVTELAWTIFVAHTYTSFAPWLIPVVAVAGAGSLAAMVVHRFRHRTVRPGTLTGNPARRWRVTGLAAGLAVGVGAMLLAPAVWAASTLDPSYDGSAMDASAGPSAGMANVAHGATVGTARFTGAGAGTWSGSGRRAGGARVATNHVPGRSGRSEDGTLTARQRRLLAYATGHSPGTRYVFAVDRWNAAEPYITGAGARVLPMGGFSGSVPEPTPTAFRTLVSTGQLRYVLLSGDGGRTPRFDTSGTPATSRITSWVRSTCTKVPASAYGGTESTGTSSGSGGQGGTGELYRCGG